MSSQNTGGSFDLLGPIVLVLVLVALVGIAIDSGWQEVLGFIALVPVALLIWFATWQLTAWIEGNPNAENTRGSRKSAHRPDAAIYGVGGGIAVGVVVAAAALVALWSWQAGLIFLGVSTTIFLGCRIAIRMEQGQRISLDLGKRRRHAELAARADEQHALYLQGEREGIYGQFMPADFDSDDPSDQPEPGGRAFW
ncbi:hypothetical protein I0Q12_11080 [Rhodococcus sp. CX]|uniref:hypothetical protein n=1 Tax=Rhodococcus sp. CX TaxID=2789880 RepID=UPI0018CEF4D2|nr:hypothetical protein [Rhodococcus sp. CX]MBH0120027.1 hypothetical protein [Rhodococcus sp. CX]